MLVQRIKDMYIAFRLLCYNTIHHPFGQFPKHAADTSYTCRYWFTSHHIIEVLNTSSLLSYNTGMADVHRRGRERQVPIVPNQL